MGLSSLFSGFTSLNLSLGLSKGDDKSGSPSGEVSTKGQQEVIQVEASIVPSVEEQKMAIPCRSDSISSLGSGGSLDLDDSREALLPSAVKNKFRNDSEIPNEQPRKLFRQGYEFLSPQKWDRRDESMCLNSFHHGSTTDSTHSTSTSTVSTSSGAQSPIQPNSFEIPPGVSAFPNASPRSEIMRDRINQQNNRMWQRVQRQNDGHPGSQRGRRRFENGDPRRTRIQHECTGYGGSMPPTEDKKEFDLSWKPKPVEKLAEDIQEDYEVWDPMAENHFSTKNIRCYDATTTLQGIPHIRGVICPHTKGSDCYKKKRCYHEHHIDQAMLAENPKMAIPLEPTPITHFTQMPLKKLARAGIYFKARVTYVRNIHEFYVVPTESIKCECIVKRRNPTKKSFKSGQAPTVESIMNNLEEHFKIHGQKFASSYSVMQLVAIEGEWNGLNGFFRAAMMEEAIVETDEYSEATVYCFDIGRLVKVRMDNLRMLPKPFCCFPPLAYRCALYGMRHASLYETEEVNDFFADTILQAKDLIVHVKIPFEPDLPGEANNGVVEEEPYLVELFTVEKDGFKELKNVLKQTHDFIEVDPPDRSIIGYVPKRHEPCDHGSPREYVEEITGLLPKCGLI